MTEVDLMRRIELERDDAARAALEAAARALEERAGNRLYEKAWKAGARLIRSLSVKSVFPNVK